MALDKDDFEQPGALLHANAERLEERFFTRIERRLEPLASREDLERVETNLLTAFHKWSSPVETRASAATTPPSSISIPSSKPFANASKKSKSNSARNSNAAFRSAPQRALCYFR